MLLHAQSVVIAHRGAVRADVLQAGDFLRTIEGDLVEITSATPFRVDEKALRRAPHLRPVRIRRNAFGPRTPSRDTLAHAGASVQINKFDPITTDVSTPRHAVHPWPSPSVVYIAVELHTQAAISVNGIWAIPENLAPGMVETPGMLSRLLSGFRFRRNRSTLT